ncbi:MAG: type II secretion system F family protein, partial [Actinomycetota bacterium]
TGSGLHGAVEDESIGERLSGLAERLLDGKGRRRRLADRLDAGGIPLRPGEFLVVAIGAGLAGSLALSVLIPVVGFVIGAILTAVISSAYLTIRADRRRQAFSEQLPDLLQLLVSSLRAGYALLQAVDSVSGQSPEPARTEFQRVLFEVRIGRDLKESLDAMAARMQSRDFDFVVAAIEINREVGGQLAGVLETIAETIRERQRLARQIRVLTAEGRMSVGFLTGLPLFLVVMLSIVNHGYFKPLTKGAGPFMVIVAVLLTFLGWFWMRRIIKAQE